MTVVRVDDHVHLGVRYLPVLVALHQGIHDVGGRTDHTLLVLPIHRCTLIWKRNGHQSIEFGVHEVDGASSLERILKDGVHRLLLHLLEVFTVVDALVVLRFLRLLLLLLLWCLNGLPGSSISLLRHIQNNRLDDVIDHISHVRVNNSVTRTSRFSRLFVCIACDDIDLTHISLILTIRLVLHLIVFRMFPSRNNDRSILDPLQRHLILRDEIQHILRLLLDGREEESGGYAVAENGDDGLSFTTLARHQHQGETGERRQESGHIIRLEISKSRLRVHGNR